MDILVKEKISTDNFSPLLTTFLLCSFLLSSSLFSRFSSALSFPLSLFSYTTSNVCLPLSVFLNGFYSILPSLWKYSPLPRTCPLPPPLSLPRLCPQSPVLWLFWFSISADMSSHSLSAVMTTLALVLVSLRSAWIGATTAALVLSVSLRSCLISVTASLA